MSKKKDKAAKDFAKKTKAYNKLMKFVMENIIDPKELMHTEITSDRDNVREFVEEYSTRLANNPVERAFHRSVIKTFFNIFNKDDLMSCEMKVNGEGMFSFKLAFQKARDDGIAPKYLILCSADQIRFADFADRKAYKFSCKKKKK